MTADLARAEEMLDSFAPASRSSALHDLTHAVRDGSLPLPETQPKVNLHCHSFFSYNAFGYSPSKIAWLSRKAGLAVAGIVDFDVLDGVEEFLEAGRLLGLRTCAGLETRVFFPEFADKVMNSPGEPGIAYHMGVGIPRGSVPVGWRHFLSSLRDTSADRNRGLVERVNAHLDPVTLDYDEDVLPLTPSGNATERHICLAYARKARSVVGGGRRLRQYWVSKLGDAAGRVELPESIGLHLLIRAKTMKLDGVGYVPPDSGSFPRMEETNRFIIAAGGIPTYAWYDGLSEGESDLEPLLKAAMASGVAALNVIPDRNYTKGNPDEKLRKLYEAVHLAELLGLPLVAGTEMNSPDHKFVDDFDAPEMKPVAHAIIKGAHIIYAHTALQRRAAMGYLSEWAVRHLPDPHDRNTFFEQLGRGLEPGDELRLESVTDSVTPDRLLTLVGT
ncbi:MAG: PHP domain-containing protein [Armatimonadota bacterium]